MAIMVENAANIVLVGKKNINGFFCGKGVYSEFKGVLC